MESTWDKQRQVLEAVQEGLLQIHGSAPNTKLPGIFWIMDEICNGFSNRIGGNRKIAKALDIKEDLDIDCLMFASTNLTSATRTTRMTSNKCFSGNWHVRPSLRTMFTTNMQDGYKRGHRHNLFWRMHRIHQEGRTQ